MFALCIVCVMMDQDRWVFFCDLGSSSSTATHASGRSCEAAFCGFEHLENVSFCEGPSLTLQDLWAEKHLESVATSQLLFLIGDSSLQHFSEVRPVGALLRFRLAPAQYMAMTMESVTQVLPAMEFKALKYHHVTVHWLLAMKQVAEMVQDTLNHQEEAKEKTLADILVCRVTIATPAMSGGDYCQWLFFILPSWGDHDQKQAMSWWRGLDGHETFPAVFAGSIYTATSRLV